MNNSNQLLSKNEQIQSIQEIYDYMDFSQEIPFYPNKELWTHKLDHKYTFLHYHNFFEIGICTKGRGTFHINGEIYTFEAPCVSIIYPQIMHSAQGIEGEDTEWNFLYISCEHLFSNRITLAQQILNSIDIENNYYPPIYSRENNTLIYELIYSIISEASKGKQNYIDIVSQLTFSLILIHQRYKKENEITNIKNDAYSKIIPAINYINTNINQDIYISDLAKLCYISEASLNRLFNKIFKISPYEYIKNVRLEKALLLLNTDKSILEISIDVGFPSISCFNKAFKKKYNISPKKYMKNLK